MTIKPENKISELKNLKLYRFLKTIDSAQDVVVRFEGKNLVNFSSNNYLGLAIHPQLKQASKEAVEKYGTGSGASRLITGSMSLHDELEKAIAQFKGCERALIFNSGYHANIGVIPTIAGAGDFIFSDELNHASLIDGCKLSKATTQVYRHNDVAHLEELLKKSSGTNRLIITDSVFSMDGDIAPLPKLLELAEKYDALLYIDEAHGTGVFGKKGCGVAEHLSVNLAHPRLIQMGTLGKALGSFGAYVGGSSALIDYLINKSRAFIYTTALPPAVLAASLAAIQLISKDTSLKEKLWQNISHFHSQFKAKDRLPAFLSPIIPIIIGESGRTMEISQGLFERGFWVQGIRPPTVAEGTARLRITIMATHTTDQIDKLIGALEKLI